MDNYLPDLERARAAAKDRYELALRALWAAKGEIERLEELMLEEKKEEESRRQQSAGK